MTKAISTEQTITILNWEKFNPRKDIKQTTWFRVDNTLAFDEKFDDFSAEEMWVWVFLLSSASRHMSSTFPLKIGYVARHCRVKESTVVTAIEKLEQIQCVQSTARPRDVHVTSTYANDTLRTNEQNTTRRTNVQVTSTNANVWKAYCDAYRNRYGVNPVQNAKINSQISQFVKRIGLEAPDVASYFLTHNDQYYVKSMHPVGMLLRDAEKLRTEWATGRKITTAHARQVDFAQANRDAFAEAAEKLGIK